jgi:hypothetical protein
MGLFTGLLTLPLAPVRGVGWVVERLADAAAQEYYDTSDVRARLARLESDLLAGRISEAEFDRREDDLLDELEARMPQPGRTWPSASGEAPQNPIDSSKG